MVEFSPVMGRNNKIKKDGIGHDWTEDQLIEYTKCMNDPEYFIEKYCKVINLDRGLVPFKLYPYQRKMINHFESNRHSIVLACRQSGKSISAVAYLLWYILFKPDKTVVILANKGSTAREMLGRLQLMYENVPLFLQPGAKTWQRGSMELSNNTKIFAAATSSDSVRGFSANLVYLDEFAFVERATEFYTSTYPVISSGQTSKIIITSTANGVGNQFYDLWVGAQSNVNEFKPFRVDWWDVPGRDEEWKAKTIANTSEIQFKQEFGNSFLGTGDTLIDAETLLRLSGKDPIKEMGEMKIYDEPKENHEYIMTVDTGLGGGGNADFSIMNIVDITTRPFEQVAVYRNNKIPPLLFPSEIEKWANVYNKALVVVETNDQGTVVANGLYYDIEYENLYLESAIKADGLGVKQTKLTKRLGCAAIKQILESGKINLHDKMTISEIQTFVKHGASYEASPGNTDDIMMTLVILGYISNTRKFMDMTDINLRQFLYEQQIKEIEDDMVPFGVVLDNVSDDIEEDGTWQVVEEFEKFGVDPSFGIPIPDYDDDEFDPRYAVEPFFKRY